MRRSAYDRMIVRNASDAGLPIVVEVPPSPGEKVFNYVDPLQAPSGK